MVTMIPFRLQGREGLGFLASVNLGFYAGMILALSVVSGKLVRHYECSLSIINHSTDHLSIG